MAQIFISHIHEEKKVAEAIVRFLKGFDLESFLSSDDWQIRAGERWFDRIIAELTEAKVVMLLLTSQSVIRPWINFEAGWGFGTKKVAIPVCFGGLAKGAMPRPYSDIQGLNLRTDYYHLVKDCYSYVYGKTRLAPPPLPSDHEVVMELLRSLDDFEKTT